MSSEQTVEKNPATVGVPDKDDATTNMPQETGAVAENLNDPSADNESFLKDTVHPEEGVDLEEDADKSGSLEEPKDPEQSSSAPTNDKEPNESISTVEQQSGTDERPASRDTLEDGDGSEPTLKDPHDSLAKDEDGKAEIDSSGGETKTAKAASVGELPPRPVKRARTAYFIFTDDKRSKVQAEHPGEGVATVARVMGQMWASMDPEEKQQYQRKAAEERERVAKELEAWKAAGGVLEIESGSSQQRDPLAMTFPMARIRKICKLDPEVRGLSKEALLLITKCAELATAKLGQECVKVAQLQNRRKLLPDDVAHVCNHREQFLFLKDDIKDLVRSLPTSDSKSSTKKMSDTARETAASGTKPLTSYFGTPSK